MNYNKMERDYILCILTFICVLVNSSEAYLVNRNSEKGELYKRKNYEIAQNKRLDPYKSTINRDKYSNFNGNTDDKETLARKDVETEIGELLNKYKAAERLRLNNRSSRKNMVKRLGWWFCDWCDGSKLFRIIAAAMKCVCDKTARMISCKCPNGKIISEDTFKSVNSLSVLDDIQVKS